MQEITVADKMKMLYNRCRDTLQELEIWPGYFKRRYHEFARFYTLFPEKNISAALEIGCGIGYQSALLSCCAGEVAATDVDFGNMEKHSRGLAATKKFILKTGISNVVVREADAQSLPFENSHFDLVYCSYSFQYIPDKIKALHEINRVLKNDGYFFCVLPTAADRIHASVKYYIAAAKKIFFKKRTETLNAAQGSSHAPVKKRNRLLPPADDTDNNYFAEILDRTPAKWKKLFLAGGCEIRKVYHTASKGRGRNAITRFFGAMHSSGFIIVSQKKQQ